MIASSDIKLMVAVEMAELGMGEIDYQKDVIILDDRAARFFQLDANTPIDRSLFHERIHPDDRLDVETKVKCLLNDNADDFMTVQHRIINQDGSIRWVRARKQIYQRDTDANAGPVKDFGFVVIEDITAFMETQEHIELLMGEVSHRAKNLLSVVQGIARMTARNCEPEEFMERFSARLTAMSSNQMVLIDDKWTRTDVGRLAKSQLAPYTSGDPSRVSFQGPHVVLSERSAEAIGMALHELATNAVKYGALSTADGKIAIAWEIVDNGADDGPNSSADGEKEFVMSWSEHDGPPVAEPSRKGFGDTVVRRMAASSVTGVVKLDYDPAGVRWELRAPLANVAELPAKRRR